MTIVGIHPEDLLDRLSTGELTPGERRRLDAHLQGCAVCRFELAVREDFRVELRHQVAPSQPPKLPRRLRRALVWSIAAATLIAATGAFASGTVGAGAAVLDWIGLAGDSRVEEPQRSPANTAATPHAVACCETEPPRVAATDAAVAPSAAVTPSSEASEAATPPTSEEIASAPSASAAPGAPQRASARSRRTAEAVPVGERGAAPATSASPAASASPAVSAADLFRAALEARREGELERAFELHGRLQREFPSSEQAVLSRMTYATLLLDLGNAAAALVEFDWYLAGHSRPLAAEALVGRARALRRLGRTAEETRAWIEVKQKYPGSIYARRADERLSELAEP